MDYYKLYFQLPEDQKKKTYELFLPGNKNYFQQMQEGPPGNLLAIITFERPWENKIGRNTGSLWLATVCLMTIQSFNNTEEKVAYDRFSHLTIVAPSP